MGRARATAVAGALAVAALAGCGDDDQSSAGPVGGDGAADIDDAASGETEQGSAAGDAPGGLDELGLQTTDGLIPELSAVPLPEGGGYVAGSAATEAQDPRQTAMQRVYFDLSVEELATFLERELPEAGFVIVHVRRNPETIVFEVVSPEAHSGQLIVESSQVGPPTYVQIEIYRSDSG
jgi:hypothetical protein